MIADFILRPLTPDQDAWPTFVGLLQLAGLPAPDPSENGRFVAVADDTGLLGFGGLDGDGPDRLLRSVVLVPALRRRGLGSALVRLLAGHAGRDGVIRLWLVADRAAPFFSKLGWQPAPFDAAPEPIRSLQPFRGASAATSTLMVRRVT